MIVYDKIDGSLVEAQQFKPHVEPLPFMSRLLCCFDGQHWYIRPHEYLIPLTDGDWIVKRTDTRYEWYPPAVFDVLFKPAAGAVSHLPPSE
jgi:hypothetical protein